MTARTPEEIAKNLCWEFFKDHECSTYIFHDGFLLDLYARIEDALKTERLSQEEIQNQCERCKLLLMALETQSEKTLLDLAPQHFNISQVGDYRIYFVKRKLGLAIRIERIR